MEGRRIPEAVTSALSVAALLGVGTFIQGYVLRQGRPPPLRPPGPVSTWSRSQDIQWPDPSADTRGLHRLQVSWHTAATTKPTLMTAAIQLPLAPVPQYRYYCDELRRFYPDVTQCPVQWQMVAADAP